MRISRATESDLAEAGEVMRRVLERDLGGYQARLHTDLDDLAAAYLTPERTMLFVARTDRIVGTAAVKPCRLRPRYNPTWLVERYSRPEVAELVRVWVDAPGRRQGVGRALVGHAVTWALEHAYDTVYLHTDAGVAGAEPFWRSLPTIEVHDARPDEFNTVHFEIKA